MKKRTCNKKQLTTERTATIGPSRHVVSDVWLATDWLELIDRDRTVRPMVFDDDNDGDSFLHIAMLSMACDMEVSFADVAHWLVVRALGDRYESARKMERDEIPWDPDVQYICRTLSLQLCMFLGPENIHTLDRIDAMIHSILITDKESAKAASANNLAC